MINKTLKFIKSVEKKTHELNEEYINLAKRNKDRSSKIKQSIDSKSKSFESEKKSRNKHFDAIRNK